MTSPWHLRAPYFFAPYRELGLRVDLRAGRPLRGWPHLLAEELGGMAAMRAQRRAAVAAMRLPPGECPGP